MPQRLQPQYNGIAVHSHFLLLTATQNVSRIEHMHFEEQPF